MHKIEITLNIAAAILFFLSGYFIGNLTKKTEYVRVLWIPPGTHNITEPINIPDDVMGVIGSEATQ